MCPREKQEEGLRTWAQPGLRGTFRQREDVAVSLGLFLHQLRVREGASRKFEGRGDVNSSFGASGK